MSMNDLVAASSFVGAISSTVIAIYMWRDGRFSSKNTQLNGFFDRYYHAIAAVEAAPDWSEYKKASVELLGYVQFLCLMYDAFGSTPKMQRGIRVLITDFICRVGGRRILERADQSDQFAGCNSQIVGYCHAATDLSTGCMDGLGGRLALLE